MRWAITKKIRDNKCWRRYGKEGTLLHCWWECKLVQPLWKTVWRFLKKLKRELPYNPAVSLLGMYLVEVKSLSQRDTYIPCLEELYLQQPKYGQLRCPWWTHGERICVQYNTIQQNENFLTRKSCHLWQHEWTLRSSCWVK